MYGMWPYQPPNAGDMILNKIVEEWWEKQKKSNKDKDGDDKDKKFKSKVQEVMAAWIFFWASTPVIVMSWYVIGWATAKIFGH